MPEEETLTRLLPWDISSELQYLVPLPSFPPMTSSGVKPARNYMRGKDRGGRWEKRRGEGRGERGGEGRGGEESRFRIPRANYTHLSF